MLHYSTFWRVTLNPRPMEYILEQILKRIALDHNYALKGNSIELEEEWLSLDAIKNKVEMPENPHAIALNDIGDFNTLNVCSDEAYNAEPTKKPKGNMKLLPTLFNAPNPKTNPRLTIDRTTEVNLEDIDAEKIQERLNECARELNQLNYTNRSSKTPIKRQYHEALNRYQSLITETDISNVSSFRERLMGGRMTEEESITSPFMGRLLRPFIYRDRRSLPPFLKLMLELKYQVNGIIPERSPIDYCYIKPGHIPAVNSLLQRLFWPGIDMTECLSYPEFSVVALYKKLVIGCAFLVPDVDHDEAYISFMGVRPEWQKSGIATFMMYHLIQTCIGKDITLHVSATNPAVCLYQKFGFRVENLVLDFYENYMERTEDRQSRHALFLRLKKL